MKKSELFIYFTVLLGCVSVAIRESQYGDEHRPLLFWLLTGLVIGLASSALWIWHYYPRTSNGDFESRAKSPSLGVISITAAIVMSFFGLSLMNLAFQMKRAAEEVQNWPSIQATIEGQQVYERPPGKTGPIWYAPTWSYSYEIDGKIIHSQSTIAENAHALVPKLHKDEAQADLQQRPIGSQVTAYYNPENPVLSVLDKRADYPPTRYLILIPGIFLFAGGLVVTFLIGRRIKSGSFQ